MLIQQRNRIAFILAFTAFVPFAFGQSDSARTDKNNERRQKQQSTSQSKQSGDKIAVSKESLLSFQKVVEKYISQDYAVGAELLVIQKGKTIYHKSFGFSDREDNRKWKNNTICNIRSMTKPLTSAALQILIDRKLLSLDDSVSKYLDGFDNDKSRTITVRQILSHRSGLPLTNLKKPDDFPSLREQTNSAGKKGPQFKPGSKFWYSDTGTDVVGALVEKISGKRLDEFVTQEIIKPLGMNKTFYGIDSKDEHFSKIASLYIGVPKAWLRFWKPDKKPYYPFAWGSQTVYSTPVDYAKFLTMIMNGGKVGDRQLLSPEAVERMLEPISRMKKLGSDSTFPTGFRNLETYYGQMMFTYRPKGRKIEHPEIIGHSGSDGTVAWGWPKRDLLILYFTQSRGGKTVMKIEEKIDQLILHPGTIAKIPEKYRPFVGSYIANFAIFDNEEFTVLVKRGKLTLDVPSQRAFELKEPNKKGEWAFALAPDKFKVTFDRDKQGKVVGLKLHQAGETREVPRKGTARAKELSKNRTVTVAEMKQLTGKFRDENAKVDITIFVKDKTLCIKDTGLAFHLRPDKDKGKWFVKQNPRIRISFQKDSSGKVVSMTRTINGQSDVMQRKK